ncbi:MAG: hypothetical protein CM15mP74_33570 [Halieaceae bacterium]|nr:MAG: hypothetical protein CM15mP74_33570 [Halieaceae bacterium]
MGTFFHEQSRRLCENEGRFSSKLPAWVGRGIARPATAIDPWENLS